MSNDLEKLPLVVNGKTVIFPCVEVMALSTTPKADGAAGYVRFYEAFAKRYGDRLRYYQLSDSTRWKKFSPKDLRKVPGWFEDARTLREPLLGIVMHTHEVANEPRPPLFDMMFDHIYAEYPRGMFRIVLPLEVVGEDGAELLELVDEAMTEFPVHWGSAGYAFYWESTDTKIDGFARQWLGRHLARHPGLSNGDFVTWGSGVEQGLATINWLTFVGDELIAQLGGRTALEAAVETAGIGLRSYAKGAALQAGPLPELGSVNRRNKLESYREVGRILAPVFAPEDVLTQIDVKGFDDPDKRLAWLRRFLP
ncbi:type VI immunity family protein [Paraliomyxa miuraensis]|uniref:type VI immunity family protein n=1 Tax=Paraliomyxa miuraensis TaxID=376150 RepID=UPI00225B4B50|nr:type VI immunity family protein [Paraliomyxa miuraensis]MCX4239736.1 DUF3396 domain-containing protein [Paraliomyxa miuraensis]